MKMTNTPFAPLITSITLLKSLAVETLNENKGRHPFKKAKINHQNPVFAALHFGLMKIENMMEAQHNAYLKNRREEKGISKPLPDNVDEATLLHVKRIRGEITCEKTLTKLEAINRFSIDLDAVRNGDDVLTDEILLYRMMIKEIAPEAFEKDVSKVQQRLMAFIEDINHIDCTSYIEYSNAHLMDFNHLTVRLRRIIYSLRHNLHHKEDNYHKALVTFIAHCQTTIECFELLNDYSAKDGNGEKLIQDVTKKLEKFYKKLDDSTGDVSQCTWDIGEFFGLICNGRKIEGAPLSKAS